jgi:hypothetical protein
MRGATAEANQQATMIADAPATAVKATNLRHAADVSLRTGDIAHVRVLSKRLEAVAIEAPSSFTRSCVYHSRGMLALAQRQAEQALAEFRRADGEYRSYWSHWGMAKAFALGAQPIELAREWREVADARGEILRDGFPPDLVEAELELGHAYVRLNQPLKAREFYGRVVDAWKRAGNETLTREATRALVRLNGGQANGR